MDLTNSEVTLSECQDIIYSNNYADFIVEFNGNVQNLVARYQPNCIQVIDNNFAIVYIDREDRNININQIGYSRFPKILGLLDSSNMESIGVLRIRRQPYLELYGREIIVGVIGTGIDYTHPVFKNADNTTRITAIWDQTQKEGKCPDGIYYGTEYTEEDINRALASEEPFSIVPERDENGHGTFLAGIAAGNIDEENDFTGIAPSASIAIVKLKEAKDYLREFYQIKEGRLAYQNNDILMGIQYLYELAAKQGKPIAICIGLGTNSGSHTGASIASEYINRHAILNGTGIVLAAGNENNRGHHYKGTINLNQEYTDVELRVGEGENGFTLELWAFTPQLYSVAFISPTGEFTEKLVARLGSSEILSFILERTRIQVDYQIIEERSGDELILIRFQNPTPGIWRIRVYRERPYSGEFHMWLPMEKFIEAETTFITPNPDTTICEPANARGAITMAAYNHVNNSIYLYSSRGYTRDDRIKPDLTAPGVNVFGPIPGGGFGVRSGTSVAAAHGAGTSALLLEWGFTQKNNVNLDTTSIKQFLIKGAQRINITYPNREWGYGTLDLYASFESLRGTLGN